MTQRMIRLYGVTITLVVAIAAAEPVDAQATQETEALTRALNQLKKAEAAKRPVEPTNIRVEVLLTDKADGKTVTEERLTMLLANESDGRLRRNLPGRVPHQNRELQVDLRANLAGDRIKLALTLQYNAPLSPDATSGDGDSLGFIQMASSFLEPGKPTVMIDAAGGPGNRRVAVQATATILR